MLRKSSRDPFTRRQVVHRGIRLAERSAMLELPRYIKRFGVLVQPERHPALAGHGPKPILRVNVFDAVNRRQLKSRLTRMLEKRHRTGADHRMIRNPLRAL